MTQQEVAVTCSISLGQAVSHVRTSATDRHRTLLSESVPRWARARARVYNFAHDNVQYIQHVQAPNVAELAAQNRAEARNFARQSAMHAAGVVLSAAEARHSAALAEQREVWQVEDARQTEAQAFAREHPRLEVFAERAKREAARAQGCAVSLESTAAQQRQDFKNRIACAGNPES